MGESRVALIIDDSEEYDEELSRYLHKIGYYTFFADDEEQALEHFFGLFPDIVLIVTGNRERRSFPIAQKLRSLVPTVRIIVIAPSDEERDMPPALEQEADFYVEDPEDLQEILPLFTIPPRSPN